MKTKSILRAALLAMALSLSVITNAQEDGQGSWTDSHSSQDYSLNKKFGQFYIGYSPMTISGHGESSTVGLGISAKIEAGYKFYNDLSFIFNMDYGTAWKSDDVLGHDIDYKYQIFGFSFDLGHPLKLADAMYIIPAAGIGFNLNWGTYEYTTIVNKHSEKTSGDIQGLRAIDLNCNAGLILRYKRLAIKASYTKGLTDYVKGGAKRDLWFIGVGYAI